MRVLVIESDGALREQVASRLRAHACGVDTAATGMQALRMGSELAFDTAVVASELPDMRGVELINQWRGLGKSFPVLITTVRGKWQDKVDGLSNGASDFLIKPFDLSELVARVRMLARRDNGGDEAVLVVGNIRVNTATQTVTVASQPLELTAFEYQALELLMINAGTTVSKQRLAERLYPEETERDSNVLEVIIGRLRRKLDPTRKRQPIETLRGRGYLLRLEPG
jgi:two-component system response regulator PhoP